MRQSLASAARSLALLLLLALLVVASRPSVGWLIGGIPLVVAGETLRVWAAGHLTKSVELVTSGPYRWVRHPLYLGRFLIFSGICLGSPLAGGGHLAALVAGVGIFYVYHLPRKEGVEPARLASLHGDSYLTYHHRVPALFPRRTPYRDASGRRWSRARFRINREIWMIAVLAGWILMQALRV